MKINLTFHPEHERIIDEAIQRAARPYDETLDRAGAIAKAAIKLHAQDRCSTFERLIETAKDAVVDQNGGFRSNDREVHTNAAALVLIAAQVPTQPCLDGMPRLPDDLWNEGRELIQRLEADLQAARAKREMLLEVPRDMIGTLKAGLAQNAYHKAHSAYVQHYSTPGHEPIELDDWLLREALGAQYSSTSMHPYDPLYALHSPTQILNLLHAFFGKDVAELHLIQPATELVHELGLHRGSEPAVKGGSVVVPFNAYLDSFTLKYHRQSRYSYDSQEKIQRVVSLLARVLEQAIGAEAIPGSQQAKRVIETLVLNNWHPASVRTVQLCGCNLRFFKAKVEVHIPLRTAEALNLHLSRYAEQFTREYAACA